MGKWSEESKEQMQKSNYVKIEQKHQVSINTEDILTWKQQLSILDPYYNPISSLAIKGPIKIIGNKLGGVLKPIYRK
jgi:hypothetical protein